jgi:hypothetical protein
MAASFQIPLNSLVTYHQTIERYTVKTASQNKKWMIAGFCSQHKTRTKLFIPEMALNRRSSSSGRLAIQAMTRGHTSDLQT